MINVEIMQLRRLCKNRQILWREHALHRMVERKISKNDVRKCIYYGEIIENYPHDTPVPSCLILGKDKAGKYIHVVCSVYESSACVITSYYPDRDKWEVDMKTRKVVR